MSSQPTGARVTLGLCCPHPSRQSPLTCGDSSTASCQGHLLPPLAPCSAALSVPTPSTAHFLDSIPKMRGGGWKPPSFLPPSFLLPSCPPAALPIQTKCPTPPGKTHTVSTRQPLWSSGVKTPACVLALTLSTRPRPAQGQVVGCTEREACPASSQGAADRRHHVCGTRNQENPGPERLNRETPLSVCTL